MFLESQIGALISVVIIDLVLAGDNAIVVGMAAAGLPTAMRQKAIVIGIAAAALLRIVFAVFATQLLGIIGLILAGGLLLLWVTWKLWRELHAGGHKARAMGAGGLAGKIARERHGQPVAPLPGATGVAASPTKTFRQALIQIVVADVSMSLDNVLAVAGTARHHVWVLVVGLALSVALMGAAATMIAGLLRRHPWISYLGLVLIAWVAAAMIWEGAWQVVDEAKRAGVI